MEILQNWLGATNHEVEALSQAGVLLEENALVEGQDGQA